MAGCRKSSICCSRFGRQTSTSVAGGCCSFVAGGCCSRPADLKHLLARLISQLCPSAGSACALLQPRAASGVSALGHATQLGEPTLVQPDPDDAWTSLADGLGVIWRAELAFSELLLHARRASLAGRPKPPNTVRWVKLRTCRKAGKWCGLSTGQQG